MKKERLYTGEPHPILERYLDSFTPRGPRQERTGQLIPSANLIELLPSLVRPESEGPTLHLINPGLIKHPHAPEQGLVWPGGAHEAKDETLLETALREAKEEAQDAFPREGTRKTGILQRGIFAPPPQDGGPLTTNREAGFMHTDYITLPEPNDPRHLFLLQPSQLPSKQEKTFKGLRLFSPNIDLAEFKKLLDKLTRESPLQRESTLQKLGEKPLYLFLLHLHEALATYKLRYLADYAALAAILTTISSVPEPARFFRVPTQHVLYKTPNMVAILTQIGSTPVEINLAYINDRYYINVKKVPEELLTEANNLQRALRTMLMFGLPYFIHDTVAPDDLPTLIAQEAYPKLCERLGLQVDAATCARKGLTYFPELDAINEALLLARAKVEEAIRDYVLQSLALLDRKTGPQLTEQLIQTLVWMASHPLAPLTDILATTLLEELSLAPKLPPELREARILIAEIFVL